MTKIRKPIWIAGILLIATIIATIIHNPKSPGPKKSGTPSTPAIHSALSVKAFKLENGWGYEIKVDGHSFIYQDRIPSIPNATKFISQADAMKCGELVLTKLSLNKRPTITRAELDSLGIQY